MVMGILYLSTDLCVLFLPPSPVSFSSFLSYLTALFQYRVLVQTDKLGALLDRAVDSGMKIDRARNKYALLLCNTAISHINFFIMQVQKGGEKEGLFLFLSLVYVNTWTHTFLCSCMRYPPSAPTKVRVHIIRSLPRPLMAFSHPPCSLLSCSSLIHADVREGMCGRRGRCMSQRPFQTLRSFRLLADPGRPPVARPDRCRRDHYDRGGETRGAPHSVCVFVMTSHSCI